jgi:hypothetical protein
MADWRLPVRLGYATTQNSRTSLRVKVKNLAVEKRVRVRCRSGSGWQDFELPCTSHYGGYDVFSGTVPRAEEFAISCSVDGAVYWDNNGFRNYRVPVWANAIGGKVSLRRAQLRSLSAHHRWVQGEVYADNLSYEKRVGIRLLPGGVSPWIDVAGSYDGVAGEGGGGPWVAGPVERWKFTSPVFVANDCRFAAFHQDLDSGEVYWDNNFAQDYSLGGDVCLG